MKVCRLYDSKPFHGVKAYIVMSNADGERDVRAKELNLFEIKGKATKEIDLRETVF